MSTRRMAFYSSAGTLLILCGVMSVLDWGHERPLYRIAGFALLLPVGVAVTLLWPREMSRRRQIGILLGLARIFHTFPNGLVVAHSISYAGLCKTALFLEGIQSTVRVIRPCCHSNRVEIRSALSALFWGGFADNPDIISQDRMWIHYEGGVKCPG